MLRATFRPYAALLLLLCLMRTLLPEAWILALHDHEHTTEEVAFARPTLPAAATKAPAQVGKARAVFSPKHTHCHSEQFYDVPLLASSPVVLPLPRVQLSYRPLAVPTTLASSAATLRRTALRGPPAGRLLPA